MKCDALVYRDRETLSMTPVHAISPIQYAKPVQCLLIGRAKTHAKVMKTTCASIMPE